MIIYLSIAIVLYWGAWTKYADKVWKIALLFLWFFIAFRGLDPGETDGVVYRNFYNYLVPNIQNFPIDFFRYGGSEVAQSGFGWGFSLICSVVKTIGGDYNFFQVIYISIMCLLLYVIVNELELTATNKCVFLFGYLTQQMLWYFCVLLRQSLANLIIWYLLIHKFQKRAWIKRIVLFVLAYTIHSSVLVVIPLFVFWKVLKSINKNYVTVFALVFGITIYTLGDRFIGFVLNFMASFVDDRYNMYLGSSGQINFINFMLRAGILLLLWYQYNRLPKTNRKDMLDASAICFVLGSVNHELSVRMTEYFMIGNYYGIGMSINAFRRNSMRIARMLAFIAMMAIFVRFFYVNAIFLRNYSFFF